MGLLPVCLTKTAYYCYCYCVTIAYYLSPCLVKKQEIGKILSSLDDTVITQEKLNENSIQAYHQRTAEKEGTMQWRTKKWQVKHSGKPIPFEQRYRLWFLHKVLAREQRNLAPTIELVLRQKQAIIKITLEKLMSIDLPPIIFKDIMEYTFPSTYQCQYYFLETHYTRLSKLIRMSYDYTPCYYVMLYSLLVFEAYFLIRYFSMKTPAKQLKKYPLKLYGLTRSTTYDCYLKVVQDLSEQVSHQLSLCGNLKNHHTMTMERGTSLQKALMSQNTTASQLAIADLSFHGIQKDNTKGYLLVPFIGSSLVNEEKSLPLTTTDFCEQAFFAPDWLADHIYDYTKIALQDSLETVIQQQRSYFRRNLRDFALLTVIFLGYNNLRKGLTHQPPIMNGFIKGYTYTADILFALTAFCMIFG